MPRRRLNTDVMQAAYDRLVWLYERGNRVVVSFSGGKDSTVCLELAIMAAEATGRLPVEMILQDEEAAYPGLYEFIEQTCEREEVKPYWLVLQQPMLNIFNRAQPYWWVMDPLLPETDWMRSPPAYAQFVEDKAIELMTNPRRFPVQYAPPGLMQFPYDEEREMLVAVIGLRAEESNKRLLGLHAAGSYMTGSNDLGVFNSRPIYDWREADVWKFISDNKFEYCRAYDVLYKMGVKRMRIGPPTLNVHSLEQLQVAARAWPNWFDRLCTRLPGVRSAVQFGKRAVQPYRRLGESWEKCFRRECLGFETPDWIRERAQKFMDAKLRQHSRHSNSPFPETGACKGCGVINSWSTMAKALWSGDPYCQKTAGTLELIEPEFFRPGAGTWAGDWVDVTGKNVKVMW